MRLRISRRALPAVATLMVLLACIAWPLLRGPSQEDCHRYHVLQSLTGPLPQDDPVLVDWVLQQLVPPSELPYNLSLTFSGLMEEKEESYSPSQEFINGNVYRLLFRKLDVGGRFVEAGAFDGEFLSNTLWLEKEYGWRGLLVEANPTIFGKLVLKRRKSWALNACLNTKPFPSKELFTVWRDSPVDNQHTFIKENVSSANTIVQQKTENRSTDSSQMNKISFFNKNKNVASSRLDGIPMDSNMKATTLEVQCLPLYTIFHALGWTHVDFLSLDLERAELGVLRTIPWDKVTFKVLAIEHLTNEDLVGFLKKKGYVLHAHKNEDLIFINRRLVGTKYSISSPPA